MDQPRPPLPLPRGPVMLDVEGFALSAAERERLQHPLVGGVILFARNYQNPEQLSALCAEIHNAREQPLLIAVDHEGGRVQRFRTEGFTPLPAMQQFGEIWEEDALSAMRLVCETAYVLASELRACGVDLSFAPVLDLDYGKSEVIGTRAFHRDATVVATLARAFIQGLMLAGMKACGKHFPGHGYVAADSHHEIPTDERVLDDIVAADMAPYQWLGDLVLPAIMPAHVIYPEADPNPAGFSAFWLQTVLRESLNYRGAIFSDDLTMEGAAVAGDIVGRATAALTAGCDMVLVCNRPDLADDLLHRLQWTYNDASRQRISRLIPQTPAPNWEVLQQQERYQYARELQSQIISG